jgi:predicted regulator of Ras-like GTPase activity (Roadblock/LC7/MglB family)
MTDYYPVLSRAVAASRTSDPNARQTIYRSARRAMVQALVGAAPGGSNALLNREHGEFDTAVARVEGEALRKFPPARPERAPEELARAASRRLTDARPVDQEQDEVRSRGVEESPMSRLDELNKILRKLQSDSPGLEASALISEDGLMIASALTPDLDETRVAGMTATLLNLGTRAAVELARGEVKEVIIRGDRGYAVMIDAGRGALLLALANETAKLGLIFFDMHEAIRSLKKVL